MTGPVGLSLSLGPSPVGGSVELPLDSDAAAYITAVESADESAMATATKIAINAFVEGCKLDASPITNVTNWQAMKAVCFLAGPKTLAGALTPLKGTAPTGGNLSVLDHNQNLGIKGNGSNKRIFTGRDNTDEDRNNQSLGVWVTETHGWTVTGATSVGAYMGPGNNRNGSYIYSAHPDSESPNDFFASKRNIGSSIDFIIAIPTKSNIGFKGVSRHTSTHLSALSVGDLETKAVSSQNPSSDEITVLSAGSGLFTNARVSFYWVGEAVDLVRMRSRLNDYFAAIETVDHLWTGG